MMRQKDLESIGEPLYPVEVNSKRAKLYSYTSKTCTATRQRENLETPH